jgi:hypothetical protein
MYNHRAAWDGKQNFGIVVVATRYRPRDANVLICDRIQQLRREIDQIAAVMRPGHRSGSEKVKHEKRILRLEEIREELMSLIQKSAEVHNS